MLCHVAAGRILMRASAQFDPLSVSVAVTNRALQGQVRGVPVAFAR
jgi:hypothetical protein